MGWRRREGVVYMMGDGWPVTFLYTRCNMAETGSTVKLSLLSNFLQPVRQLLKFMLVMKYAANV